MSLETVKIVAQLPFLATIQAEPMETVRLFRVFLSAPSDVIAEKEIAAGVLREWNIQHGQEVGVRVELVHWRTHVYPAAGNRPQSLINKQAFARSDIIVGIFWTRFGTSTGRYGSGTEEELRRGIAQNKSVMAYFSRISPPEGRALQFLKDRSVQTKARPKGFVPGNSAVWTDLSAISVITWRW